MKNKPHINTIWFDSARDNDPRSKNTYVCTNPIEVIYSKNGKTSVNGEILHGSPLEILRNQLKNYGFNPTEKSDGIFRGGAAGLFGFDLGRQFETIPHQSQDDTELPDMLVGIYLPDSVSTHVTTDHEFPPNPKVTLSPEIDKQNYLQKLQSVIDYIHAGDIFQACLSQRFSSPRPDGFNALAHYIHMRSINPAPYAAFLDAGDFQLGSCSPEQFLKVVNGQVETRPIKGTLPTHQNPELLLCNAKECAENAMIVDLLRNDLARTCNDDSVIVTQLNQIETYEGLYHLVSAVTAHLQDGKDCIDLLQSCFPGGSISGAPKIRACEIIDELEQFQRGAYCGSIGWIGFDGAMDTNILIRTVTYLADRIIVHSGGGIVADSNPEHEYQETLLKAQKIMESF